MSPLAKTVLYPVKSGGNGNEYGELKIANEGFRELTTITSMGKSETIEYRPRIT